MNDFQKHQLKEKIKKKKGWIIGTGIFALVGMLAWMIGMFASGQNPFASLVSPFAITIYILLILLLLVFAFIFYVYFINKKR